MSRANRIYESPFVPSTPCTVDPYVGMGPEDDCTGWDLILHVRSPGRMFRLTLDRETATKLREECDRWLAQERAP